LPNRRFFAEWLAFAIAHAGRTRAHVGVLFIDIGGCAAVVEHHGAPAAEALLVEIARRFRGASRGGDVFARLGPAQFALATPNAEHLRELSAIAQRLRDVLDDPAQPPLADSPIGTSIGMAFYPEDAGDSAGVMAAANAAMYAARRAGRRHVAFNALAA
jgi:diguanylate cyclase (GGDEF)-like protein